VPYLPGHTVQEGAHRFEGGEDFAADLLRGPHRFLGNQASPVAVPRDNGGCHFMVEGKALAIDICERCSSAVRANIQCMSSLCILPVVTVQVGPRSGARRL
jgi:hypothetical protein